MEEALTELNLRQTILVSEVWATPGGRGTLKTDGGGGAWPPNCLKGAARGRPNPENHKCRF